MTSTIHATFNVVSSDLAYNINLRIDQTDRFTTVPDNDPDDILPVALTLFCLQPFGYQDKPVMITHIGLLRKGQRVATSQIRLKASDLIALQGISIDSLVSALPERFRSHGKNAFSINYKKVGEKTGIELYKALLTLCPLESESIKRLNDKLQQRKRYPQGRRNLTIAAEKDALGVCLDIFGADRSKVLASWVPDVSKGDGLGSSFLSGLTEYTAYEDDVISQDLHNVPGFSVLEENISGVVEFRNAENERLTVINANRKPLEKAYGVDLIYFHRQYEAFTFVQYKMMDQKTEDQDKHYYNPNQKSHNEELARMQKLYDEICKESPSEALLDYRIGKCPIFFKVCKKLQFKANETTIAPGAYIPLDHWKILIKDTSTKGPKGGRQIGYHTLKKRYVGTQVFVELMKKGFLGTQSISSKKIAPFIEEAIKKGHSVLYAVDESTRLSFEED